MGLFSSSNTFDPDKDIPDLSGRVYVVTGGSSGIGLGIISHLLQHHASKIYLLSNKSDHATSALEHLKSYGDAEAVVQWRKCDLADFGETKEVVEALRGELEKGEGKGRLDAVVANAGVGVGVYRETGDGVDSHMQINHFSQLLLIQLLLPLLHATPNSRIVLQSSDMHRLASSDTSFSTLEELNRDIGPTRLYSRSKLAQILFVRALHKRVNGTDPCTTNDTSSSSTSSNKSKPKIKIFINATHPGGVNTPQQSQAVEAYGTAGAIGVAAVRPFLKDPISQGCRPALWAATSDAVLQDGVSGCYVVPDRKVEEPSSMAVDDGLGERLWGLGEEILGGRFGGVPW